MRIFNRSDFNKPSMVKNHNNVANNTAKSDLSAEQSANKDRFNAETDLHQKQALSQVKGDEGIAGSAKQNEAGNPKNVRRRGRFRKALGRMFGKRPAPQPQPKPAPAPVNTNTVVPPNNNVNPNTVVPPNNTANTNTPPTPAPAPVDPVDPVDPAPVNTGPAPGTDTQRHARPVWANMGAEEQKFFDRSFDAKGFKDKQVGAWRQTTEGNCVSVAAIKGAMDKYDNQVFDKMTKTAKGVEVTMKDGVKVKVSPSELRMARNYSDFKGTDQDALSYATVCYAAMAKRAQNEGRVISMRSGMFGRRTSTIGGYKGALMQLNNGEAPTNGAKYLGLKHKLERIELSEVQGRDVLASNSAHAFFVDKVGNDNYLDKYGKPGGLDSATGRFAIKKAYILRD